MFIHFTYLTLLICDRNHQFLADMELCESSTSLFLSHMYFVCASCLVLLGGLAPLCAPHVQELHHMEAVHNLCGLGHLGDSQRVCLKAMSRVTSKTFFLSPACSLSSPQSLPKAPLSLPCVTATARWWSRLAMMLM